MEIISQLSAIILPVFICAAIGLLWTRIGQPFDSELISDLVFLVGAPCLIISTFATIELSSLAVAELALAALAAYVSFAMIGIAVLKLARLSLRSYLPSLMFPLTGSMGLPVCLFAFGDAGLALALIFLVFGGVGTYTVGAAIAAGRMSFGQIARTPVIYAAAVVVAMLTTGWSLPAWAVNTTSLLGGFVIPLQLFALGASLGRLKVASIWRSVGLAALRLGMGFAVGYGIAEAMELERIARGVVIIQCAMPVAVSNYLMALVYRREPEEVAGMVLISTAVAFLLLPFLLLLVL
jgi:hypothetical protein